MTMPAGPLEGVAGAERLLFTRGSRLGPRLGFTFQDRRQLISPYDEPSPDPQAIATQLANRRAKAQRAWSFAIKWVARPLLPLAMVLYALGVLTGDATHHMQGGGLTALSIALAVIGLAWPAWCLARLLYAQNWDPVRVHQVAVEGWHQRASDHEHAELARLDGVPEWASAGSPGLRTDVYGGTLGGWQSLLAVHGASILAAQPLLVADFSGHLASRELTALARRHGVQGAIHMLPTGIGASGILAGLTPSQFANALAEAIHAGSPGAASRADRAVDVRVLGHIASALGGNLTPARLAAAMQAALGQPVPHGLLTPAEAELIGADLFRGDYRAQVGPSLLRLDAYLADLALYAGPEAPQRARPAWYTCFAMAPGGRSASAELLTALTVQWLTVQVSQSTATSPAVIIAGADEITRSHLEALADACDRHGVPLTLLFRHLRDDATMLIGGAATTAFMRLTNHHEAEQGASFIGRQYTFTVSGWTATRGGEHSTSRTTGYSHGQSTSRGYSTNRGWSGDGLAPWDRTASGGRTRSRDRGSSQEWSESDSESEGISWSTAENVQRVYEYAVEPTVLQSLPANALLLPPRGSAIGDVLAVECDPQIIMLPGAAADLAAAEGASALQPAAGQGDWPALAPPSQGPAWQHWRGPAAGNAPAWQPQQPGSNWRRPGQHGE
jgi:hypothetical protein